MNNQHVQVPKMNLKAEGLAFIDPYVYACIKKYMNQITKQAFPSIETLKSVSDLTKPTLLASIKRLEQSGYIEIYREFGKPNYYKFNDYKKFEICSFDLLDRKDIDPKEKAYFIATQPFMFKDDTSGHVTYSQDILAEMLNLTPKTLRKYESALKKKNLMQVIPYKRDNSTGVAIIEKIYDFEQWSNLIALKFQEQDSRIDNHDHQINRLKSEVEFLKQELRKVKKEQLEEVKITL